MSYSFNGNDSSNYLQAADISGSPNIGNVDMSFLFFMKYPGNQYPVPDNGSSRLLSAGVIGSRDPSIEVNFSGWNRLRGRAINVSAGCSAEVDMDASWQNKWVGVLYTRDPGGNGILHISDGTTHLDPVSVSCPGLTVTAEDLILGTSCDLLDFGWGGKLAEACVWYNRIISQSEFRTQIMQGANPSEVQPDDCVAYYDLKDGTTGLTNKANGTGTLWPDLVKVGSSITADSGDHPNVVPPSSGDPTITFSAANSNLIRDADTGALITEANMKYSVWAGNDLAVTASQLPEVSGTFPVTSGEGVITLIDSTVGDSADVLLALQNASYQELYAVTTDS